MQMGILCWTQTGASDKQYQFHIPYINILSICGRSSPESQFRILFLNYSCLCRLCGIPKPTDIMLDISIAWYTQDIGLHYISEAGSIHIFRWSAVTRPADL
jgi:hypothetical protein